MKTEDELDAEIAKLFDEVTENAPGGTVKKRLISDEETIAEMDFKETQAAFLVAEKKFRHLSKHPNVVTYPKINFTSATRSSGSCTWGKTGACAPT